MLLVSRSIMIAFIVTLALLFSSAIVSVQASEPNAESTFLSLDSSKNHYQIHPVQCPKLVSYSQASGHHCCASICLLKLPTTQSISIGVQEMPTLTPRYLDDIGKAITRSKTLFRPPIT